MAPKGVRRENVMAADISFDLQRLYDPYNFDHIPVDDRLSLFKQRDLPHVRHYKAAVKIFGGPPHRTRVIVAPPMETPLKHRLGIYQNVFQPPEPPKLNGPLKPQIEIVKQPTFEENLLSAEEEKTSKYKKWINERKRMRNDLENLGLDESFLARKPDKSELEKRVQAKFRKDRLWRPESPPPKEITPEPTPLPDVPSLTVPPPDGLQILDKFLSLNRMRLMDLFRLADKDKSWTISRSEFLNAVSQPNFVKCIRESEIPLTESEIDDIIITLDSNNDDELDYQEINKGLTQWKKNRRELKRQGIAPKSPLLGIQGKLQSKDSNTKPICEQNLEKISTTGTGKSLRSKNTHQPISRECSLEKTPCQGKSSKTPTKPVFQENTPVDKSSLKKNLSKESFSREKTMSGKAKASEWMLREKNNASKSKLSFDDDKTDNSIHGSQQKLQMSDSSISNLPVSQEKQVLDRITTVDASHPMESVLDRSVYEDIQTETARATATAPDTGELEEVSVSQAKHKRFSSHPENNRPGSHKAGSVNSDYKSQSRSSTPNVLEPPDFDLRDESRNPESPEAMVDIRKHDRVVLSRSTMRRSLSREQKVVFDEVPGVIKVGYKPIDDHCSESTLTGGNANMVNQFRREKLKEYFEVKKLCEERGLPLTHKTLDRVLLYPGDLSFNQIKKEIAIPLGPLTNEMSPFNKPKPKKKSKKRLRGMGRVSRMSGANIGNGGQASSGAGGDGVDCDADRSGSGGSRRNYVTVEDVYPFAQNVAPKVYKENLSSGRALISRKVDNWMTFEEYSKYTQHLQNRFSHLNRHSNPDTIWPGSLLDKLRICMPYDSKRDSYGRPLINRDSYEYNGHGVGLYNGSGSAMFCNTSQPKRAYPGYNNDLNTWPVGEHGVRYANIDEHRLIK